MSSAIFPAGRLTAAVCKRGHIWSDRLEHADRPDTPKFCPDCGAPIITRCEKCQAWLLGGYELVLDASDYAPNPFCFNCGAPHAWASREQRIVQLFNVVDFEEGLDEAGRLEIAEALAVLSRPERPGDNDEDRVRAGERIRDLAPHAWKVAQPVLSTLISGVAKKKLRLE